MLQKGLCEYYIEGTNRKGPQEGSEYYIEGQAEKGPQRSQEGSVSII